MGPEGEGDSLEVQQQMCALPMQAARALQEALPVDEVVYTRVVGHAHTDARAFFVYHAMDEVFKATILMTEWEKFIRSLRSDRADAAAVPLQLDRPILEAIAHQMCAWVRKLVEILVSMICFSDTNEQEHYRLYLAADALDAYVGEQKNQKEFFECESRNIASSVDQLTSLCRSLVDQITDRASRSGSQPDIWFVHEKGFTNPKPGRIFRSARQKYCRALRKASLEERLALGLSYGGWYGTGSGWLHLSTFRVRTPCSPERIKQLYLFTAILGMRIVLRAHELTGLPLSRPAETISEVSAANLLTRLQFSVQEQLRAGDLVVAQGTVAEVLDTRKSDYGYCSALVRFLCDPPIPEIQEDWEAARHITFLMRVEHAAGLLSAYLDASPQASSVAEKCAEGLTQGSQEAVREALCEIKRKKLVAGLLRYLAQEALEEGEDDG